MSAAGGNSRDRVASQQLSMGGAPGGRRRPPQKTFAGYREGDRLATTGSGASASASARGAGATVGRRRTVAPVVGLPAGLRTEGRGRAGGGWRGRRRCCCRRCRRRCGFRWLVILGS